MCRIAPVHGRADFSMLLQDFEEVVTVPGLKEDEQGLFFVDIKIRVCLIVFLTVVLVDTRNYFFDYVSFSVRDILPQDREQEKRTIKKDG